MHSPQIRSIHGEDGRNLKARTRRNQTMLKNARSLTIFCITRTNCSTSYASRARTDTASHQIVAYLPRIYVVYDITGHPFAKLTMQSTEVIDNAFTTLRKLKKTCGNIANFFWLTRGIKTFIKIQLPHQFNLAHCIESQYSSIVTRLIRTNLLASIVSTCASESACLCFVCMRLYACLAQVRVHIHEV